MQVWVMEVWAALLLAIWTLWPALTTLPGVMVFGIHLHKKMILTE